jgi:hypothetical protein
LALSQLPHPLRLCRGVLAAAAMALASLLPAAHAADSSVPYVPTPQSVVDRMLEIGKVGPHDYLIDLGSGDGRIVVTAAAKHGTRGFGVDLNPTRIDEANENARQANVTDKVAFYQRDLFETDLSQASVITMYLLPRVNLALRPKLLNLKPGTRIVSHDFSMGEWKPDLHEEIDAGDKYGGSGGRSDIYLWIIPANVEGTWRWQLQVSGKPVDYEIALEQTFQMITGTARIGGRSVRLQNATLRGDRLSFDFTADLNGAPIKHHFAGTVDQGVATGTADLAGARLQAKLDWSATRTRGSAAAVRNNRNASAAAIAPTSETR